jgi:MarR-like DNA-binding transcriptional regulator SgrR of sgrS sRNA
MSAEYAAQLTKNDHQELLDRQPVGTGPFQVAEYRSGNIFACSAMNISGAAPR